MIQFKHWRDAEVWRKRLPFMAANGAFLLLVLLLGAAPLYHIFVEGEESLAERRATLARYEAVAGQEAAVREYARQVKEINAHGDLLEGSTAGVIAAALQSKLKAMAETAGVTVRSIQALPPKSLGAAGAASGPGSGGGAPSQPAGGAGRASAPQLFGARVEVSGTPESIHSFTRAIETGPPLLIATAAMLNQPIMMWRPQGEETPPPEISAQIDVYGGALAKDQQ
ncbi:type II secretion system protein GspM [Methylocystis heyeri]|nr:type II secretion system protein GspM [Methylocystis heyeri]